VTSKLANFIRQEMAARKMSIRAFAEYVDVANHTMQRYVEGNPPTIDFLAKLAKATKIDLLALVELSFPEVVESTRPSPEALIVAQRLENLPEDIRQVLTQVLCGVGGFFLLLFGLLSWRNAAGARAEQRHQDLLAIERERNWIMQGGQSRSTRNTPSAYEEEPLDRLFPERRANMERLERMRREGKLTSEAEKIWSQSPRPPARKDFYNAMFPDRKEDPKRVSGSIQNTKRKR